MNKHGIQENYISQLIQDVPSTATGEIEIHLSDALSYDVGSIIIDRNVNLKEESIFFHRRSANVLYAYGTNRSMPVLHTVGANVIQDTVWTLNYLVDNTFEQMYIYQISSSNVHITGGNFFIDRVNTVVPDLDTTNELIAGEANNIYLKDGEYFVTTDTLSDEYFVGTVYMSAAGNVIKIDRAKTFNVGGGLTNTQKAKLDGIDLSQYILLSDKVIAIGATPSDNKILSEKAIADELDTKVDKVAGRQLSQENFTTVIKAFIDSISGKDFDFSRFQTVSNLLTAISATPADDKYLSEKAIKTELDKYVLLEPGKGLSDNNLTDALVAQINTPTIPGIQNVTTHGGLSGYISGDTLNLNVDFAMITKSDKANLEVYPVGDNSSHYTSNEVDKNGQRYVVLPDRLRSGFRCQSELINADSINNLKVFTYSEEEGDIEIQTHISIVRDDGVQNDKYVSEPYVVHVNQGHSLFELNANSFSGLTLTDSEIIYIQVFRSGKYADGVSNIYTSNHVMDTVDTLENDVFIKSCTLGYTANVVNPNENDYLTTISYTHGQVAASNTWNVNHNIGTEEIIVDVYDENDNTIGYENIEIIDDNNIQITFTDLTQGKAVVFGRKLVTSVNALPENIKTHIQVGATNIWNITHGLGTEDVVVQAYDDSNNILGFNNIEIISSNIIQITFTDNVSGTATIIGDTTGAAGVVPPTEFEISIVAEVGPKTIVHSLNKYPHIILMDSSGDEVTVSIKHTDKNTAIINWLGTETGTIYAS